MISLIKIENFKKFENLTLSNLEKINLFLGENASGKTSICEAIQFCLEGSVRDIDKIHSGKSFARVTINLVKEGNEIEISTEINKEKEKPVIKTRYKVNGVYRKNATRTLLKKFFSVGAFDPFKVLDDKNKYKAFDSLLPAQKFSIPKEISEIQNAKIYIRQVMLTDSPIENLINLRKSLELYRKMVGSEKRQAEFGEKEVTESIAKIKTKLLTENIDIETMKSKEDIIIEIEGIKCLIDKFEEDRKYVNMIKEQKISLEKEIILDEDQLNKKKEHVKEISEKIEKYDLDDSTYQSMISQKYALEKEKLLCDSKEEVERLSKIQKEKEGFLKEKTDEYKHIDILLKKKYKDFFSYYVSQMAKKLDGVGVNDSGDLTYLGKELSHLSRSEKASLAIKIDEATSKDTNIRCIDNCEMFDDNTIKRLNLNKEGRTYFLFRVDNYDIKEYNKLHKVILKKNDI